MLPFRGHARLKKYSNDIHKLMAGLTLLEKDPDVEYIVLDSLRLFDEYVRVTSC